MIEKKNRFIESYGRENSRPRKTLIRPRNASSSASSSDFRNVTTEGASLIKCTGRWRARGYQRKLVSSSRPDLSLCLLTNTKRRRISKKIRTHARTPACNRCGAVSRRFIQPAVSFVYFGNNLIFFPGTSACFPSDRHSSGA